MFTLVKTVDRQWAVCRQTEYGPEVLRKFRLKRLAKEWLACILAHGLSCAMGLDY